MERDEVFVWLVVRDMHNQHRDTLIDFEAGSLVLIEGVR